jgi:small-conductance mechanosensitive channel
VGGILIFVNGIYRVGDRIEIENNAGDVIDIGIMYTTLLELKGWMSGDQATGRLTIIPNGLILSNPVFNYTKDHKFIWDEIVIPITYDSDWRLAIKKFETIAQKLTFKIAKQADKSISKLEDKYYFEKRLTKPSVYMKLTDNWIDIYIKYTIDVNRRRIFKDKLYRFLLKEIEKTPQIKLASATFDIVGFPEISIKQKG